MTEKKIENVMSFDGWENLFTGIGVLNRDSRRSTSYNARSIMGEGELNQLYSDNGLVRKIVNKHVEMMMKRHFLVDGDPDNLVRDRIDEIKGWPQLSRFLKWNRLHGGAILLLGIDDGRPLEMPVDEKNIRSVGFFRAYSRWRVHVNRPASLYNDRNSPKYGEPELYTITPFNGLPSYNVHETRCVVLDGEEVPETIRLLNQGWGLSYIQHCYEQLRALGEILGNVEVITKDFITQTVQMENLMELISGGKEDVIKRRLQLIDQSRHSLNTVLLDSMEKFEKKASTVSGLESIMDKFMVMVSAVSCMPMRILFGEQGGGLNNEGEGESNDWYDQIESDQINVYRPALETIIKYIMLSDDGGFSGKEPQSWSIKFSPLKQMTEKERSEIRKNNAEADSSYVNSTVLLPEEVAVSRFGGDEYGEQIVLDQGLRSEMEDNTSVIVEGDRV